ncbi:hypothetical protein D3C87_624450 [compost metagenome]
MNKGFMVSRREADIISEEYEWLTLGEIFLIKAERRKGGKNWTVFYTKDAEFVTCLATEQLIKLLSVEEGFVRTDRGMMANLNQRLIYDSEYNTIRLQDGRTYITVTVSNIEIVKKYL